MGEEDWHGFGVDEAVCEDDRQIFETWSWSAIVYKSDGLGALDEDAAIDLVADFTGAGVDARNGLLKSSRIGETVRTRRRP